MTTSCAGGEIRGSSASTNSVASATVLCIFQFAARYGVRSAIDECLHPGQLLTLQQLQRSTSSCRQPVHIVREPELLNRRDRVAAAENGRPRGGGDGLGDGPRPGREGLHLEGAHRPVPKH